MFLPIFLANQSPHKGESGSKTQTFNSNMIRHYVRDIEIRTGRSIPRNQREKLKEKSDRSHVVL